MTNKLIKSGIILTALSLSVCVAAGLSSHSRAFAADVNAPVCPPPANLATTDYGRCENAGFFTGEPSTDNHVYLPIPNPTPPPSSHNVGPNFSYTDQVYASPYSYWSFPQVPSGCNGSGGSGTGCKDDNAYAQIFTGLMEDYLEQWNNDVFPKNSHGVNAAPTGGVCFGENVSTAGFRAQTSCNIERGEAEGAAMIVDAMMGIKLNDAGTGGAFYGGCANWGGKSDYSCGVCDSSAGYTNPSPDPNWFYDCYEPAINNGIQQALSNFSAWKNIIIAYDASSLINWDETIGIPSNTLDTTGINRATDIQVYNYTGASLPDNFIILTSPFTGQKFLINRSCGNIVGAIFKIQTLGTISPTCGTVGAYSTNPVEPSPGQQFTLTLEYNISSSGGIPFSGYIDAKLTTAPGTDYGPEPTGGAPPTGSFTYQVPPLATSLTAPTSPGTYSGTYSVYGGNASSNASGCPFSFTVATPYYPYFTVSGGDSVTGSQPYFPYSPDNCTSTESTNAGSIIGPDPTGNTSSGDQFALQALGEISGFASADFGSAAGAPYGLDFSNNTSITSPANVGYFGSSPCMPDFGSPPAHCTGSLSSDLIDPATSKTYTGSYCTTVGTNLTTSATGVNVTNGTDLTIFVNGDLIIRGNITFNGGWTSISDIPSLTFVVSGNVIIEPAATQLYGVYDSSDTIYTCSTPAPLGYAGGGSNCGGSAATPGSNPATDLDVYGSFIANQIDFERTDGDVSSGGDAAEEFNYGPATWIAGTNANQVPYDYDTITGLPPVL